MSTFPLENGQGCDKCWASLIVQLVKNLPAMQETLVQFLGQEDPLEKVMATQSRILTWKISWTEEPVTSWSCKESEMTK